MSNTKAIGGPATPASGGPVLGGDIGRIEPSAGRATPRGPSFGAVLAGARPILKGAEAVASVLPGGPLVAAAVRAPGAAGSATFMSAPGGGAGGVGISPRVPLAGAAGDGAPIAAATPGISPSASAAGAEGQGVEGVLAESQAFNLYYLQLQEEISAENRQYSALSNVLKARHDTVKNAIGNIR
jgi:hypothetical protein